MNTIETLFAEKNITYKKNKNDCWICTSHKPDKCGYPKIQCNGRQSTISRWIYGQIHGSICANLVVRHKCDNPSCINPEHLEPGTVQDNVNDRVIRGREGDRKGSKNGRAKLNEALIPEIITRLKKFEKQKDIALDLGISQQMISRIKNGKAWKTVNEMAL
jgi:hypothetical protein